MATVHINLTEYDALRNSKVALEKEIEALKEDIRALKDSSKVIVRTIHDFERVEIPAIYHELYKLFLRVRNLHPMSEVLCPHAIDEETRYLYTKLEELFSECVVKGKSTIEEEYIGFSDAISYINNKLSQSLESEREEIRKLKSQLISDIANNKLEVENDYRRKLIEKDTIIKKKEKEIDTLRKELEYTLLKADSNEDDNTHKKSWFKFW
jgi:regulator of replication initiation timing